MNRLTLFLLIFDIHLGKNCSKKEKLAKKPFQAFAFFSDEMQEDHRETAFTFSEQ